MKIEIGYQYGAFPLADFAAKHNLTMEITQHGKKGFAAAFKGVASTLGVGPTPSAAMRAYAKLIQGKSLFITQSILVPQLVKEK